MGYGVNSAHSRHWPPRHRAALRAKARGPESYLSALSIPRRPFPLCLPSFCAQMPCQDACYTQRQGRGICAGMKKRLWTLGGCMTQALPPVGSLWLQCTNPRLCTGQFPVGTTKPILQYLGQHDVSYFTLPTRRRTEEPDCSRSKGCPGQGEGET